jgi:hypothetical protein
VCAQGFKIRWNSLGEFWPGLNLQFRPVFVEFTKKSEKFSAKIRIRPNLKFGCLSNFLTLACGVCFYASVPYFVTNNGPSHPNKYAREIEDAI